MATTTKIYRNDGLEPISLLGVGEILPGGQVSVTAEYHSPINLANYPTIVDVLAEEEKANAVPPSAPEIPFQSINQEVPHE